MSGYVDTYPQTQAQWDADTRLFNNQTVAVVTDGVNIGRKKWFDGIQTFAQLDYIDAAAAGSGITSINLNVGPAIELRIPLDAMWTQINNAGAPAAGEFEANSNVDATAVTSLTFHSLDAGTNDQSAFFASMRIGGLLTGRQTDNDGTNASGTPCVYRITAAPTLASSRYTIAVAHVSGVFIGSFPNWYVSYAGNRPVEYSAILNQAGTAEPVATGVVNELGGTPAYAYVGDGEYALTITGAFPATRTKIFIGTVRLDIGLVAAVRVDNDVIRIQSADTAFTPTNDVIKNVAIRIVVDPA